MKLTKKEQQQVAVLWLGALAISSQYSSFEETDLDINSAGGITKKAQSIGKQLLGNHPCFNSVQEMIDYVISFRQQPHETH